MDFNAYAGQRILYKGKEQSWRAGYLVRDGVHLNDDGLNFNVIDGENGNIECAIKIKNIFFNARELTDWETDPYEGVLIPKEQFIDDIENENLKDSDGEAFVSDGKYVYYSIPRLNANWIRKQPFDYVAWYNK